jgi:hypothetical protein
MEWCIPIQTFQIENVQLGSITRSIKPIVPLAYKDSYFHFPSLSFLLPNLTVKSYDFATGRLVLSLAESIQTLNKLQTLQDMLLSAVNANHTAWYNAKRKPQEVRAGFQPMILNSELHLYCPLSATTAQPIPVYENAEWAKGPHRPGSLKSGKRVRVALRFHGISFHIHPVTGEWTGKFRIQHKIIGVIIGS